MILKTREVTCMLHKNYISLKQEHSRTLVMCVLNGGEEFRLYKSCEQIIFADSIQVWINNDI